MSLLTHSLDIVLLGVTVGRMPECESLEYLVGT